MTLLSPPFFSKQNSEGKCDRILMNTKETLNSEGNCDRFLVQRKILNSEGNCDRQL